MINFNITTTDDQGTVADGFEMGQFAFYGDQAIHKIFQTDQDLISYMFSEMMSCLQPIWCNDAVIPGSPNFAVGYVAGYVQAYLDEQHR